LHRYRIYVELVTIIGFTIHVNGFDQIIFNGNVMSKRMKKPNSASGVATIVPPFSMDV
jgi:hypothetical protein